MPVSRRAPFPWLGAALAAALLAAGCASRGPVVAPALPAAESGRAVELTDTPFFPQTRYQCGPAALATVLSAAGVDTDARTLAAQVYVPEKRGSLQVELLAASRRHQRLPYRLDPEIGALLTELRAGRPVLVFQNLGVKLIPYWHYAVAVGYDPQRDVVILRSGTDRRRVMAAGDFLETWERTGKWAIVVLPPGELPAQPEAGRFLSAVAAMEPLTAAADVLRWLEAAARRWPDNALVAFASGNTLYDSGRPAEAENAYRRALALDPSLAAARNNLAHLLLERGCPAGAMAEIDRALATLEADRPQLEQTLLQTRSEIRARGGRDARPDKACSSAGERPGDDWRAQEDSNL